MECVLFSRWNQIRCNHCHAGDICIIEYLLRMENDGKNLCIVMVNCLKFANQMARNLCARNSKLNRIVCAETVYRWWGAQQKAHHHSIYSIYILSRGTETEWRNLKWWHNLNAPKMLFPFMQWALHVNCTAWALKTRQKNGCKSFASGNIGILIYVFNKKRE